MVVAGGRVRLLQAAQKYGLVGMHARTGGAGSLRAWGYSAETGRELFWLDIEVMADFFDWPLWV